MRWRRERGAARARASAAACCSLSASFMAVGSACTNIVGVSDIAFTSEAGADGGSAHDSGKPPNDGSTPVGDAQCSAPSVQCGQGCVDPKTDEANCGSCGHSCVGGGCAGATCRPVSIAGADLPNGIAVDLAAVYWTNTGVGTGQGSVMKLSLNGSNAIVLANDQAAPYGIAVDAKSIYWTNYCCSGADCAGGSGCNVLQAGLDGSKPLTLASDQDFPAAIAIDDANVYWASYGGDVNFAPKGGDGTFRTVAHGSKPSGIAVCGASLFWTDQAASSVYELSLPPLSASIKVSVADDPYAVACSGTTSYWATAESTDTSGTGGVFDSASGGSTPLAPLRLQTPVNLDSNNVYPNAVLASDGTNLFYVDTEDGTVNELPKGGAPIVLASGQFAPFSIALYPPGQTGPATTVYWVNRAPSGQGGGVVKVAAR